METTEHGITPFDVSGVISFWWGHHNAPSEEDRHNGANHQRLGQYLYNNANLSQPWPELFYEEDPAKALVIWWSNMERWESK